MTPPSGAALRVLEQIVLAWQLAVHQDRSDHFHIVPDLEKGAQAMDVISASAQCSTRVPKPIRPRFVINRISLVQHD